MPLRCQERPSQCGSVPHCVRVVGGNGVLWALSWSGRSSRSVSVRLHLQSPRSVTILRHCFSCIFQPRVSMTFFCGGEKNVYMDETSLRADSATRWHGQLVKRSDTFICESTAGVSQTGHTKPAWNFLFSHSFLRVQ